MALKSMGRSRRQIANARLVITTWVLASLGTTLRAERPHIVYVLADDLGFGDLGCYNDQSKIPTPHIDQLAREGIRFTDAHTPSAVCSPTRYGVLTGRYAWRTWLTESVLDGFDPPLIEENRLTVPKLLARCGYATACIGKWHLGMTWRALDGRPLPVHRLPPRPGDGVDYSPRLADGPLSRGFEQFFGISASLDMAPYCFVENDRIRGPIDQRCAEPSDMFLGLSPGVMAAQFRHEAVLPELTQRAVRLLEDHAASEHAASGPDRPLFLYLPLPAPHLPVVPTPQFEGRSRAGRYGDFVVQVDDVVGQITANLERAGMADDTLLIVTSDNGGLWHWWEFEEADDVAHGRDADRARLMRKLGHRSNGNLRGRKADVWEGGHRVPFIARWPGRIPAGLASDELVELTDLLATCAAIVGETLPADAGEDSYNILPALLGQRGEKPRREAAVHHSLHGMFAIRQGPWKLILGRGSGGFSVPQMLEPRPGEAEGQLYDLADDLRETRNRWNDEPETVARLEALLARYRNSGRSAPVVPGR